MMSPQGTAKRHVNRGHTALAVILMALLVLCQCLQATHIHADGLHASLCNELPHVQADHSEHDACSLCWSMQGTHGSFAFTALHALRVPVLDAVCSDVTAFPLPSWDRTWPPRGPPV